MIGKKLLRELRKDVEQVVEADRQQHGEINPGDMPRVLGILSRVPHQIRANGRGHVLDTLSDLFHAAIEDEPEEEITVEQIKPTD